jgi:vesicle-associated membrane protein 7
MERIEYVAVLRGHTVIASYGDSSPAIERDILKLLPATTGTEQLISTGHLFSFFPTTSLTFVCASPQSVDKQRPLQFLNVLSRRWIGTYGPPSATAGLHALDSFFAKDFAGLFAEFNQAKTADLARELDETQRILTESVSRAFDRGSDLQTLASKSESLISTSEEFRRNSVNLRKKMQCQWLKSWAWTIVILLIVIYFIVSRFCGGFLLPLCL